MSKILDIFKALADEGRLRILRAIDQAELSVAELVQALDMPQSTVSRHLKPMREAGLVASRRDGTSVYYNRGPLFRDAAFARILKERLQEISVANRDAAAVERVVEQRRRNSRAFFDEIAGRYDTLTDPGGGWQALAAGLAAGFLGKTVGDLGCGEGVLTLLLARFAEKIIAFDQSEKMLALVAEKAEEQNVRDRIDLRVGNLETLELQEEAFDALFLSQSLHHTTNPEEVVRMAERQYMDALVRYRDMRTVSGQDFAGNDPAGRFAALDALVATTQAAVREAPADPFLNGILISTLAERQAALRRVSGNAEWY